MRNLLKIYFYLIILSVFHVQAQQGEFRWPIDSPRVLTGNYGELRPNHFHAGLDFSTNGKIGFPVYAVADGYVSRIRVSAVGYGNSIYITHPGGKVSVYGHLSSFFKEMSQFVKKEQYARESFEIDINLKPEEFKIKKGKQIGLSGNSGGSTGPHLHFELRDEKSEVPLNPLEYYEVADDQLPVIERVAFYNLSDTCSPKFIQSYKVKRDKKDSLMLENDTVILKQGILGFAFAGFDKSKANGNANNIYAARVYFDNKLVHAHRLDQIDFADARFVNEFCETVEKLKYQKCFMPTLYPPNLYEKRPTKGRILLSDTNYHTLKLSVYDENANERVIQFTFKTRKLNYYAPPSINSDVYVNCNEDLMIGKKKLQIFIPANTLYYSTGLIFENTIETSGKVIILPREINLRSTCIIGFEVPKKLKNYKDKLILNSGSNYIAPMVKRDSVFYSVKNLGSFLLEVDTVAPTLKLKLTAAKLKTAKGLKALEFIMSDKQSGISKYKLTANDKWVLAEYDAKNDAVICNFDENIPSGTVNFVFSAEDKVGNKSQIKIELKR